MSRKRKQPSLIKADNLVRSWGVDTKIGDRWYAGRPIGFASPLRRLYLAWKVFKGDYDALRWGGGQ